MEQRKVSLFPWSVSLIRMALWMAKALDIEMEGQMACWMGLRTAKGSDVEKEDWMATLTLPLTEILRDATMVNRRKSMMVYRMELLMDEQ